MRSTVATVNLNALRWNLHQVQLRAGSAGVLGMVKANAYGHGIVTVAKTLAESGIDMLGVAFVDEAVQLRQAGISKPIIVLTPTEPHEADLVIEHRITTVACSLEQAQIISERAVVRGVEAETHLYVDTGMHRDGVYPKDAPHLAQAIGELPGIHLTGICTHFATSDEPNHPFITEQLGIFQSVLDACAAGGLTFAHIHAANTGAIWQTPRAVFTLVRPGLSLYGYASPADDAIRLQPVLSLSTRVIAVRRIRTGDSVSYGRRFISPKDTTIVTIPIGYGDGYSRSLSGKSFCLIRGKRYPIVGTICMDECMVDVGDDSVEVGDEVMMLGSQTNASGHVDSIDASDLAQWANTIPYEITTSISSRVPRSYTEV